MTNVYGIKNCGSVKKATQFLNSKNIEFEFVDLKKAPVDMQKISSWSKKVSVDKILNNKGTTYKTLNLKELNLDESQKLEWLCKNNMLIKRPVIEHDGDLIVGFDEELYKKVF